MYCNGEVLPDSLALPVELVDPIADWASVYDALDRLWLDSGAYERWAATELGDLDSSANRAGLAVRARIDSVRRCYYCVFDSGSSDVSDEARRCPVCAAAMTPYVSSRIRQLVCETCSLVAAVRDPYARLEVE
jgi:predicted  nucleic acid-binding Zn ribbon protein